MRLLKSEPNLSLSFFFFLYGDLIELREASGYTAAARAIFCATVQLVRIVSAR